MKKRNHLWLWDFKFTSLLKLNPPTILGIGLQLQAVKKTLWIILIFQIKSKFYFSRIGLFACFKIKTTLSIPVTGVFLQLVLHSYKFSTPGFFLLFYLFFFLMHVWVPIQYLFRSRQALHKFCHDFLSWIVYVLMKFSVSCHSIASFPSRTADEILNWP